MPNPVKNWKRARRMGFAEISNIHFVNDNSDIFCTNKFRHFFFYDVQRFWNDDSSTDVGEYSRIRLNVGIPVYTRTEASSLRRNWETVIPRPLTNNIQTNIR